MKILIMAGGSGERFWPLSTKEKPKQLLSLVTNKSMIRETVERMLGLVDFKDIYIATNEIQAVAIKKEIPELNYENMIIEPAFKDTAAAIAYGCTYISKYEDDPTIIVLAADHIIKNNSKFLSALKIASKEAKNGSIVTLGIIPTRPDTGYGYIKLASNVENVLTRATKFLEKPNYETALSYLKDGGYVWNSGMFIFNYNTIMNELNKYSPNHVSVINQMRDIIILYDGLELSKKSAPFFNNFNKVSIDYAVMEKSNLIKCIPVDIGWSDIGDFNSLGALLIKDENDNVVKNAKYIYVDSKNNIIIAENQNKPIATIGIENMVIVNSESGLLICNRDDTQKIRELIKKL